MSFDKDESEQAVSWNCVYTDVSRLLEDVGIENDFGKADYLLIDDNYGFRETNIEIHNLRMLEPKLIARLRGALHGVRDWQISIAIHVPGTEGIWPAMGLLVRRSEIIDGLQRQYFPEPYRSFQYEGARSGTEYD